MYSITDTVLIRAVKDEKAVHHVPNTDIKIQILPNFRQYDEDIVTQSGTVVSAPLYYTVTTKDSDGKDKTKRFANEKIKVGDKVYCHHFLTHEENDASFIAPNTWKEVYQNIYCKITDGAIEMVGRWNFIESVSEEQKKGEIYLTATDKKKVGIGVIRHPSDFMKSQGIKEGMFVEFKRNAGYVILVEGKKYFRLEDDHILLAHAVV
jgi:hypothetical protein